MGPNCRPRIRLSSHSQRNAGGGCKPMWRLRPAVQHRRRQESAVTCRQPEWLSEQDTGPDSWRCGSTDHLLSSTQENTLACIVVVNAEGFASSIARGGWLSLTATDTPHVRILGIRLDADQWCASIGHRACERVCMLCCSSLHYMTRRTSNCKREPLCTDL